MKEQISESSELSLTDNDMEIMGKLLQGIFYCISLIEDKDLSYKQTLETTFIDIENSIEGNVDLHAAKAAAEYVKNDDCPISPFEAFDDYEY